MHEFGPGSVITIWLLPFCLFFRQMLGLYDMFFRPLHSLTVYDFQVTVMLAVAMGCHVWDDCVFCSLNGGLSNSFIWHQLGCVSTMELIGWPCKADPRERLILTGKQRVKLVPCKVRHLCTVTPLVKSIKPHNMWFNWCGQKCYRLRPFLKRAGDHICGTENRHRSFHIYFYFWRFPIAKMTTSLYFLLLMPSNLLEN
jgi:hypothetical protein